MGKNKLIEKPEDLLKHFNDYRQYAKDNPYKVKDWVGGMGLPVVREKERPLTLEGFEVYCFEKDIIKDLGDYFRNKDERYTDYATICSHIKAIIRGDQIEGGMAGMYNPSITQRLNGLADKQEVKVDTFDITLNLK